VADRLRAWLTDAVRAGPRGPAPADGHEVDEVDEGSSHQ
jgi:hypothetical protein